MNYITKIVIAATIFFQVCNCSVLEKNKQGENDALILVYNEFKAIDEYQIHDTIGNQLKVFENGKAVLSDLIYQPVQNEVNYKEVSKLWYFFSHNELDSLISQFRVAEFEDYSSRIPENIPDPTMVRTPAVSITISYKAPNVKTLKEVSANLGISRKYYPEKFLGLYSFLSKTIIQIKNNGTPIDSKN